MSEMVHPDSEIRASYQGGIPLSGVVECASEQIIDPVQLGRRMVRTMRFTFAVAQGDPGYLHHTITKLAASKYRSLYGEDEARAAVATVNHADLEQLRLPGRGKHSETLTVGGNEPKTLIERQNIINAQFRHRWNNGPHTFGYELNNPSYQYEPGNKYFDAELVLLIEGMMGRDASYVNPQTAGRPVGESGRDPRQSFVRDYVLLGQSIGDPVINTVLADAREIAVDRTPQDGPVRAGGIYTKTSLLLDELYGSKLPALAAQWEQFHPGEAFIDQEAIAGTRLAIALAAPYTA